MIIVQYIKRKNKNVGVLVALRTYTIDKNFQIGWSLCHKKDKFDKYRGTIIAIKRAEALQNDPTRIFKSRDNYYDCDKDDELKIPYSIRPELNAFITRAGKYYKNLEYPEWVQSFL